MTKTLNRLKWMVLIVLLQVLVLNQLHINGYAVPFLYVCFLLKLGSRTSRNELLLWGFFLGITIDMFNNTPGMNAIAATVLAFFRTPLLKLMTIRDMDEDFEPGIRTLGLESYLNYALIASTLLCTCFMCIDVFSFFHLSTLLLKVVSSTVSTMICVLFVEFIGREKR